jgi:uncharacterized heparinase superfamily protein
LTAISKIKSKARSLTVGEMIKESLLRLRRKASQAYSSAVDSPSGTYPSTLDLESALGSISVETAAVGIKTRSEPHLTAGLANLPATVDALRQSSPASLESIVRDAGDVISHKITLFEKQFALGSQINWHRDPTTGTEWPRRHFTRTPIVIGGGSDVKYVWELSRFHHMVTLGQAFAVTGDDRYTAEFLTQLESWREQNPPRFGVNWTVAMEAAVRSVNLVAALDLFRASPLLDHNEIGLILRMLLSHGRFIRSHLEFSYSTTSNHYLSDLIGLAVIGMSLPELAESEQWINFSVPRLLAEMNKQILPDGVDYELSTAYHRFVLEIFITLFSLMTRRGFDLPAPYWERLKAMFDFVRHYLKPDGTAPLLGDSDDGRLIRFQSRSAVDHSYLMSIAAVMFNDPAFRGPDEIDPEAAWWFGHRGKEIYDHCRIEYAGTQSKGFTESQIFIQRSGPLYAIIDCGDNGVKGRGSHAHSDSLSLEVFAYGRTLLRDPGTFVYTGSAQWRNRFRSTLYHSTVRVDEKDICQLSEDSLFALGNNAKTKVGLWEVTDGRDILDAVHDGYLRLNDPLEHRRKIQFEKPGEYWIIEDFFESPEAGKAHGHLFEFCFNFDSGLEVTVDAAGRARAVSETGSIAIVPISGHPFDAKVVSRWVSLAYGTKTQSFGIIYSLYSSVPFSNTMLVVPYRPGDESKIGATVTAVCISIG